MHLFITLAHQAIETYLKTGQVMAAPTPLPPELASSGAVFVSLHTKENKLRGCRGTLAPTEPNLAEAIIHTAIASATADPRFLPMVAAELAGLDIKIDLLSPLEPVEDSGHLDHKVYGVLIQSGPRRAVLLPDIPMVESVSHQLELVRRKAGISPHEPAQLFRFTVTRYQQDN